MGLATSTKLSSAAPAASWTGVAPRRACACGNHIVGGASCPDCSAPPLALQRRAVIGASDDPLEHEADRAAEAAVDPGQRSSMGDMLPSIRGRTSRMPAASEVAPASVDAVRRESGQPLDRTVRREMEDRFGHDFSGVRVHTGGAAARSASDVGATAYTVGRDIVFGAGQYAPSSGTGRRLLAHELAHTIQQQASGAASAPTAPMQRQAAPAAPTAAANAPAQPKRSRVGAAIELLRRAQAHFASGDPARKQKAQEIVLKVQSFLVEIATEGNMDRRLKEAGMTRTGVTMIIYGAKDGVKHLEGAFRGAYPMSDVTWKQAIDGLVYASRPLSVLAGDAEPGSLAVTDPVYAEIKEAAYKGLVDAAIAVRRTVIGVLRAQAMKLPPGLRSLGLGIVDVADGALQIAFNFVFYVIGVIVGLGEGLVSLVTGVLQIIYALLKVFADIIGSAFGKTDALEDDFRALKAFIDNFVPGLKKLFSDWTTKLANAPQERQSAMIGELVGQIVAFIVTWEGTSAKLSKLPKITANVPVPALAQAAQAGIRVPVGRAVPITVDMAKLGPQAGAAGLTSAQAVAIGTGGQHATTGSGGSGSGGSGSGGSGSGRGTQATINSSEMTLPGGKVVIKSEGRVGDAPAVRPGVERKYPLANKIGGLPDYVRFHVEGIKAIGDELNVVYTPSRFNISETALIENQIRAWQAEVKATGGELYFDFTAKCHVHGEVDGVTIKVLDEITWKLERRIPGGDAFETLFEHTGKP